MALTVCTNPQDFQFKTRSSILFCLQVPWTEIIERGRKITQRVPLNGILWYPGGSMKKSRLLHNICVLLFHMIPAYFIDALLFLAGYKPM